jgi:hypothetical protein
VESFEYSPPAAPVEGVYRRLDAPRGFYILRVNVGIRTKFSQSSYGTGYVIAFEPLYYYEPEAFGD